MVSTYSKPLCEMTAQELADTCEKNSGIPTPPHGAPMEVFYAWYVATIFVLMHKCYEDPTEAREAALEDIICGSQFEKLRSHTETAIGRLLTTADIEAAERRKNPSIAHSMPTTQTHHV